MGLRSMNLITTLTVVVVVLLVGTLLLWPALARRGVIAVALRIALVSALQASTLGLVFAQVNRSYEFYSSWSDLLGTNTSVGRVVAMRASRNVGVGGARGGRAGGAAAGGSGGSGSPAGGSGSRPIKVLASRPIRAAGLNRGRPGRLETVRISGLVSGITVRAGVYLPPASSRPLPVVVVIGSGPGGAAADAAAAASAIALRRLPPSLVAVLPAAVAGPASRGCLDVPGGPQATTFFTQDLPQALAQTYHVAADPSGWAVVGGAGGSYCALQLATSPGGEFGLVAVGPGAYTAPPGGFGGGLGAIGASPSLRDQVSVVWRLRHLPQPAIRLLVTDPGRAMRLLALVRSPMQAVTTALGPAQDPLAPVFDWIGRALGGRA